MSLLSLFSRKKSDSSDHARHGAGASSAESAQPVVASPSNSSSPASVSAGSGAATWTKAEEDRTVQAHAGRDTQALHGKDEDAGSEHRREQALARREQLYGAVRESLLRVGILAASYRFKVLALDQTGLQYLVMIDLASNLGRSAAQMTEIEAVIADHAKSHCDIAVTAVYWRVDDRLGQASAVPAPVARPPLEEVKKPAEPEEAEPHGRGFEPLQTEEMLAFKRALAVTPAAPIPGAGARPPARGYSPLATGYEDTQIVSPDTRPQGQGGSR
jgi:hypothetical protein